MTTAPYQRRIRSFVLREGRLTPAQQRAMDECWPSCGLNIDDGLLDFTQVFGRTAPVELEIGFGNGDNLLAMAAANPARDYIGIEVHRPGVGHLLKHVQAQQLTNVRVFCHDAVEVLAQCIPAESLAGLWLLFADPWHKKRHHKRRIVQTEFADRVAHCLIPGGQFHLATDWENYAEHMLDILNPHPQFNNAAGAAQFVPRPDTRPLTRFENRGLKLGHVVRDLLFIKKPEQ